MFLFFCGYVKLESIHFLSLGGGGLFVVWWLFDVIVGESRVVADRVTTTAIRSTLPCVPLICVSKSPDFQEAKTAAIPL